MKTILFLALLLSATLHAKENNAKEKGPVVTCIKIENLGDKVIIPKVSFHNAELVEVLYFLQLRSREILGMGSNINFVLLGDPKTVEAIRIKKMELTNVSLNTVLKLLCKENELTEQIDKEAIVISPKDYKRPVTMVNDDNGSGSKKLDSLTMNLITMQGTDIETSVMFLKQKSKQLDAGKNKLQFVVNVDAEQSFDLRVRDISLRSVSLRSALGYICEQSGCQYSVKGDKVTVTPLKK